MYALFYVCIVLCTLVLYIGDYLRLCKMFLIATNCILSTEFLILCSV